MPEPLISVVFPLPIDRRFIYRVPKELDRHLPIGIRVLAPFGRRVMTGFVVGSEKTPPEGVTIRDIIDILDDESLLPPDLLAVTDWMARHYHTPRGMVMETALPRGLTPGSRVEVEKVTPPPSPLPSLPDRARRVLEAIPDKRRLKVTTLARRLGRGSLHSVLRVLETKGLVVLRRQISSYRIKAATDIFCRLEGGNRDSSKFISDLDRVEGYLSDRPGKEASLKDIIRELALSPGEKKSLKKDPRFGLVTREIIREPHFDPIFLEPPPKVLTPHQKEILEAVIPAIEKGGFTPALVHGVTGSGKTEIYLKAAEAAFRAGKSVLVLVPEIGLTPQILGRFRARFKEEVAVFHSAMSVGERLDQWKMVRDKKAKIALGARSAVFAPLADLGLIVVDEEQDGSYKQEEAPRYNARDVALVRGRQAGAVVLLGSATPSLESFRNARIGRYVSFTLPERIGRKPLPEVTVIDGQENQAVLPEELTNMIHQEIDTGGKVLILLNRRGFSPAVLCRQCGWVAGCPNCNLSLTFHLVRRRGVCHYCDHSDLLPDRCPKCGAVDWAYPGMGTERLEEELTALSKTWKVLRMDRDTTSKKGSHQKILRDFMAGPSAVLVGTQMIAKGHHLPEVGLVGILGIDDLLSLPDFRAAERAFHLLTQAAGRAGRGRRSGRVAVVTNLTDHYVVQAFAAGCREDFYEAELEFREQTGYPPFSRLVRILTAGPVEKEVRAATEALLKVIKKGGNPGVEILGPAVPPLARLRNLYRMHLVLRAERYGPLHKAVDRLQLSTVLVKWAKRVTVTVDFDPYDFM